MNNMILRNQQELLCHCGNTRKAKPIRQAKTRLLLILAALLFGGKGWGQTYHHTIDWGVAGTSTTIDYNYIANTGYPFYNWAGYLAFFDNDPFHNGGWCNVKITLKGNVTINVPIIVAQGQTIDIETNGNYTITRGSNIAAGLSMFYIGGSHAALTDAGTLIINDTGSKTITIDGGSVSTTANGSAINVHSGCTLTCKKCTFQNNIAHDGGAIASYSSTSLTNCTFNSNTSTSGGGGAIYANETLSCNACTFTNNTATAGGSGGAVYYAGSSAAANKATFTNGTINGNSSTYKGGAIIIHKDGTSSYCVLDMTGTTVYNNTSPTGGGIALHKSGTTFNMTSGEIYSNKASNDGGSTITGNGGGVHIDSGSTFNMSGGNIGKATSGSTTYYNQALNGGGVYSVGAFNMTGGNIYYNTATDGAGLYMNGGTASITTGGSVSYNTASQDGGGVYVNDGIFSVSASREIIKNKATRNGGGVYVGEDGTFNSNGLIGKANYANTAERGAGVYTAGELNIQDGNIQYNTMTGTAKLGAGVYIAGGTTTMSDGAINNNITDINGGGIYIDSNASFILDDGKIYSNTAKNNSVIGTSGGGGVYNAGTFTMDGGEIYSNTANANTNTSGGGVCTTGTFNMSAGTIGKSGNLNKSRNGAGVCVGGGTFTMTGGDIIFNEASYSNNGSDVFCYGGGVYIASNGTFKLKGGNVGKIVGTTSNLNKAKQGGGVYIGGGTFEFTSGEVQYNTASADGGGVYLSSGTFTMAANTSIHDNKAVSGGGIYLAANGFTLVSNNSIYSNTATNGAGVYVSAGITFSMSGGEIYSNTASTSGGGVYIAATNASTYGVFNMTGGNIGKYDGSSYLENKAAKGGGVYVVANGQFTMENGNILGNKATTSGGGIYTLGSVTATSGVNKIYNNQATNTADDRYGGGVFIGTTGTFSMTNGEIYNNLARNHGGGIYIDDDANASLTLVNTKVFGNSTTNTAGAGIYKSASAKLSITGGEIYSNQAATYGGGIYIHGGTGASATTLTGVSIGKTDGRATYPNTAKVGGGIYIYKGAVTIQKNTTTDAKSYIIANNTMITGGTTGGGIHMASGTLNISDTEITGNTSTTTGGGIHIAGGTITNNNSSITSNTSLTNGGGIYIGGGTFNLQNGSEVSNNKAITSGTNIGFGGGIYSNAGTLNISNSTIQGNQSLVNGGGIYKKGTVYVWGIVVIKDNLNGAAKTQTANNVFIHDGASEEFVNITADGLDCGSSIGITKSHSYTSSTYTQIAKGLGTAPVPANNCGYAYRNRFFFDDTETHTVTNSTTSPYYNNGNLAGLYFVKNANYNTATNPWIANADATGCTLDGNGFVTAVNNAAGMAYFAQHILAGNDYSGKTVSLTADIDLSGHNWEPIGYAAECLEGNSAVFNGTFDGQGHTITNITSPFPYDNMGLFGAVGDDGVVKNTVVANVNFTGSNTNTGAVAGLLNGSVYNCSSITQSGTGTTAASLVGEVGADGSLKNCFVNTSATNGLANENGGTIENCYMRGATSFVGGTRTGTVNYCYAPSGSVSGTNSVYGATDLTNSNKYGFAHSDQQITSNSNNTHIVNGAIDNHGELKGLLATLNHWVKTSGNGWNAGTQSNSNGYALWTRTMASPINGDYPVLMMPGTVCVGSPDGTLLDYASDVNTLMTSYTTSGDIYLYATNPTALGGTSGTTRVYINEHVGVLQTANTTVNARVGVTLDNSSTGYMSYDWHMFSSALTAAPLGLEYHSGVNDPYLVKTNYSTYLSNGIPHTVYESATNMDPTKTTWNTTTGQIGYFPTNTPYGTWRGTPDPVGSFDFYCYHEPTCHWINFKREGTSSFYDHWRENEDPTTHTHLNIPYENESSLTPGKGYLVALSQPSMLMADGVLNNGDASSGNVSINVTASDINFTGYEYTLKGINLIGNPFQSYLDFDEFASYSTNTPIGNTYYILDADKKGYVSYTVGQTDPPAPKMLHPHQGFYVKVPASQSLQFTPDMRATTGAVFRDDKPSYPLVNLVCTDGQGRNDFATVELDRPEAGGGEKVLGLHSGDASVWIHTDEADWQTAFTTPGLREVPVRFKAYKDGFFTISWNTMNADFNYMHLIDNLNGTDIDCLNADEYHFEGKVTDYSSRFRLVLEYTDVEENEDDASTGSATFAFMMGDELVVNSGSSATAETALLEMFDLNGRCLLSKELHGEQSTLHMPTTAPGIYVLRLTANRQTRTQKMVIR